MRNLEIIMSNAMPETVPEKVIVTLGNCKWIVVFKNEASQTDKSVVTKQICEELHGRLTSDGHKIVLQMKNVLQMEKCVTDEKYGYMTSLRLKITM